VRSLAFPPEPPLGMTRQAVELIRRFLMHVVPERFTRVRYYYGLLANRVRGENVAKARDLIGSELRPLPLPVVPTRLCPQCRQGTMWRVGHVEVQKDRTWFDTS